MKSFAERFKFARKRKNISQGELANIAEVSQGTISKIERGESDKSTELLLFAKILECDPYWLQYGELNQVREDSALYSNIEPTNHSRSNEEVPEISYVQAGEFTEAIDIHEPGYADSWHPRIKNGNNIYVLRVRGDSMTSPTGKSFPEEMLLHIDPDNRSPNNGDYVIAKIVGHGDVTFKQFKQGETKPYLQPLNTRHQAIYSEFRILGVVVFAGWEL